MNDSKNSLESVVELFSSEDFLFKDGSAYYKQHLGPITQCTHINSQEMANIIRAKVRNKLDQRIRSKVIDEVKEELEAMAYEAPAFNGYLSQRVGLDSVSKSVLIDLGDEQGHLVVFRNGKVEIIEDGDEFHHVHFLRSPQMQPMILPLLECDWREGIKLLKPYVNASINELMMLIAYITYVLSHPKAVGVPYPILVIQAEKGSGKSFTSGNIIRGLTDPNSNSTLIFPRSNKDLAIHSNSSYVLMYDNMRSLNRNMSDLLCSVATGSSFATRKLYADSDLSSISLHSPLVLNGIHSFVKESDLADRCLRLSLAKMDEKNRRSERELKECRARDLPIIFGSLLQLSALLLQAEPNVKPVYSASIMDFSVWLAAFELVAELPNGSLQKAYKDNVKSLSASGVEHDSLTIAFEKFIAMNCKDKTVWEGEPSELLRMLQMLESSYGMPKTAASLTVKLKSQEASFNAAGIYFLIGRSKKRFIKVAGKPFS
ncbi:ATP-binding protein [Photobacterium sp. GB-36]|uniref:ATP-binding protein n=1 Tax=Photobacterium sp. GB-36 TaxID=2022108 RepID=UPI000D15AE6F|nr:ATP-binding protein [Photobacterium sp. GB-36]PSV43255.1 ATP-binding protein [Photobacterium sp. GB-36]